MLGSKWTRPLGFRATSTPSYAGSQDVKIDMQSENLDSLAHTGLAIVGGGAAGLAVAAQVIEKAKAGSKAVQSITIFEPREHVGPGLAYSSNCVGTILNAPADTMGFYHNDPTHFSRWTRGRLAGLDEGAFVPREAYGQYLWAISQVLDSEAEELGIKVTTVHQEVVDTQPKDGQWILKLADGQIFEAEKIVLALGNFPAMLHPEFAGSSRYFSSPWPNSKLSKKIPSDASVVIFGSRLTAVDAVIYLAEHGHKGPITCISRTGRLPQIRAENIPLENRYRLNLLMKEVENNPKESLLKIVAGMKREVERGGPVEWSKIPLPNTSPEYVRGQIEITEAGGSHWQTVLRASDPLVEYYWRSFSMAEKILFLKRFSSLWASCRHTIPVPNARIIRTLLESGQLKIVKGGKARRYGKDFMVSPKRGPSIHADYVIEALGQETNLSRIRSPLLQSLLSNKILKRYPAGGVDVNFDTCEARPGFYVIGTLTKGVHFFTSAVERMSIYAARIADHLVGDKPARPLHVAVYLDPILLSDESFIDQLLTMMVHDRHTPFIYTKAVTGDVAGVLREELDRRIDALKMNYGIPVKQLLDIQGIDMAQEVESNYIDMILSISATDSFNGSIESCFHSYCTLSYDVSKSEEQNKQNNFVPAVMLNKQQITLFAKDGEESVYRGSLQDLEKIATQANSGSMNSESIDHVKTQVILQLVQQHSHGKQLALPAPTKVIEPQYELQSNYQTSSEPWTEQVHATNAMSLSAIPRSERTAFDEEEARAFIGEVTRNWFNSPRFGTGKTVVVNQP